VHELALDSIRAETPGFVEPADPPSIGSQALSFVWPIAEARRIVFSDIGQARVLKERLVFTAAGDLPEFGDHRLDLSGEGRAKQVFRGKQPLAGLPWILPGRANGAQKRTLDGQLSD